MSKSFWALSAAAWALLIFRLTTMPQITTVPDTLLQQIMMSGAHFFFFGTLAVFTYITFPSRFAALSLASVYGLVIELVQRGIPGRSADPVDWLLDTFGAVTFLLIIKKLQYKA